HAPSNLPSAPHYLMPPGTPWHPLASHTPCAPRLETLWNARLDVAITGESGAGKSTFVNALRGLSDEDAGAAQTGVTETTAQPTAYPYPGYPNVTLWDLPGIGTPSFRADGYLQAVDFPRYDFFIILASERFKENHVLLARAIVEQGKRFYFVRAKVDNDLEATGRKKNPPGEEEVLEEIRRDCRERLGQAGLADAKVFLLSSFELEKYDFQAFEDTLERELPGHKRHAFLLSLPNLSGAIVEKKRQLLHQEVWKVALVSSLVAAVPLPGLAFTCDVAILLRKLAAYRQDFGLDAASLARLAERAGKPLEALRAEVRSALGRSISKEVVIGLLGKATGGGLVVANFFFHRIPIYGALACGSISFHTTYSMLSQCLEELAADSQRVLVKAFDSEVGVGAGGLEQRGLGAWTPGFSARLWEGSGGWWVRAGGLGARTPGFSPWLWEGVEEEEAESLAIKSHIVPQ
uniref:IRG-type G domain-containing protein n=1 Tax=Chelydra serpentina TaxID=8475 RepID=A0A8C3SG70_CHESE